MQDEDFRQVNRWTGKMELFMSVVMSLMNLSMPIAVWYNESLLFMQVHICCINSNDDITTSTVMTALLFMYYLVVEAPGFHVNLNCP